MAETTDEGSERPRAPLWHRLRLPVFRRGGGRDPIPTVAEPATRWRRVKLATAAVALVLGLYYPVGMLWVNRINDDLSFGASNLVVPNGASRAVAIAAALIQREVVDGHWTANDPFFMPAAALDNMPNFQQGIIAALARFTFELTDQIGRVRGSSRTDPDLQEAAGLLQYSGTKWVFDFATSLAPTATSEAQYARARIVLLKYNQRLSQGNAVFERRADNLLATLDRIALDIGSTSASLYDRIGAGGGWLDTHSDDVFYGVKGQVYAYYLLLRELQRDFANVIAEKELGGAYAQLLESLAQAVQVDPWYIVNGAPDSQFAPNHLAAEGFFVLRARTQLREITDILLK